MCGICGNINFDSAPVKEELIREMMLKMKHRGPDDDGVFIHEDIGLGFVRLSIIDLSSDGHQPMISRDGRYVMVFNGEIFNYIELRNELKEKGIEFFTQTDSEVLMNSFIYWGEECLNHFNGMWAFVILDRLNRKIFGARDRHGIKPFYYYLNDKTFYFASEIPPILTVLKSKPEPNNQAIFDYLVFNRTDTSEKTFFKNIKKLQHGCCFTIVNSEFKLRKWYNLRESLGSPFSDPEEYRELFSSAVGLRLRSDVPVGVCLSGGLDSSSITSVLLQDYKKTDLNTFSAVYGTGISGDESKFINLYTDQLRNMYYTTPDAQELFNDLSEFISCHAEPIPSTSPYAQYKLMELAAKHVVVTLDGQGADEAMAGYHYFFGFYFKDLFRHWKFAKLFSEMSQYILTHRSVYGIKSFFYLLLPLRMRTNTRIREKGYLNEEFIKGIEKTDSVAGNLYSANNLKDALLDHFEYKLEHLLKWEDRNSMRFSIEARVPFLDYRLVEKVLSTPSKLIINKGMTKYLLRQAMKGTLPEDIRLRRDKIGFETPEDDWFRTPIWKKEIFNILSSQQFKQRGYINSEKANRLFQKHLTGEINISKEIWKWIHLEYWFRMYID